MAFLLAGKGILRSVSCMSNVEHASSNQVIPAFFIINTRYSVHKAPELGYVRKQAMTSGGLPISRGLSIKTSLKFAYFTESTNSSRQSS